MINRRDFIRTSVLAGGALFAQTAIPSGAADFLQGHGSSARPGDDGLPKGVCDIHLHCRPDSRERSVDEYGFMKDAMSAGYRAVMGVMFTSDRVQMTDEDIVNVYKESYK